MKTLTSQAPVLRAWLLRPLVYYCESEGASVPLCPGIFVSLFVGDRLHCVAAAEVLEWAHGEFGLSTEQLRDQYGTAESPAP